VVFEYCPGFGPRGRAARNGHWAAANFLADDYTVIDAQGFCRQNRAGASCTIGVSFKLTTWRELPLS
jgi:hypothetical protein